MAVKIKIEQKYFHRLPAKKIIVTKNIILHSKPQLKPAEVHENVKHEFIGNDLVSLGADIRIPQAVLDGIFSNKPGVYVIKLAELAFGRAEMENAACQCGTGKPMTDGLNAKKLEAIICE
jgi:hypothetical protein